MTQEIVKYLSKYTEVTEELVNAIHDSTYFKNFKKGTLLLKEGEYSNECFFVLKGGIRSYIFKNAEERTIEFYTEEEVVTPPNYGQFSPSSYYFECFEDTSVCVGNPELEQKSFDQYPQLASLARIIAEKIMAKKQDAFSAFKISSPEERYLNLLESRSDLIQRVPHYQIASYLGITPESLSRIKRRIMNKMRS